ncbi:hypothetical protein [Tuwongella immobilis]|uniref:hypothetical protein n=1 Tax=Tuwongella immobilis TaxID=692036 RepID=UPI0013A692AD|nr:hypothetical protein [Tuwongella immobilis]
MNHLHLGFQPIPRQNPAEDGNRPIFSFVAGPLLLTSSGFNHIEDIKPGDLIRTRPDDDKHNSDEADYADDERHW